MNTIRCGTRWRYVSEKDRVQCVFGIADDILFAEFDVMGRDHDDIPNKVLKICRQTSLILKQTQVPIKVYKHPVLW